MSDKDRRGQVDFQQAAMEALDDFKEAEEGRQEALASREAQKGGKSKIWLACQWLIFILCLGVTLYQIPDLMSAVTREEKPLNKGVVKTDALTDQCLRNLWQISKELQEGKKPNGSRICPASKKPYEVV